jgi:hypothetical protein
MRAAVLQSRLGVTDRSGAGTVAEVYPAAALRVWGLAHRSYKGAANAAARGLLVDALRAAGPWLDLGPYEALCRRGDHAFDAVVCALVARAAATGRGTEPPAAQRDLAAREGWIVVPTCGLTELAA